MNRFVLHLLLLLALAGFLPSVSFAQAEKTYGLAVMRLKGSGISETEAETLSETLHTGISQIIEEQGAKLKEKYSLLERSQMDKILETYQIQDCIDVSCAVDLGKQLAVDRIIVGSVGLVGETYVISCRIVDVGTSKVIRSVSRKLQGKIDGVIDLIPLVGQELLTSVKPTEQSIKPPEQTLPDASKTDAQLKMNISDKAIFDLTGIKLVSIPEGSFLLGSNEGNNDEKPIHTVTLSAFSMSATEITRGQYKAVMGSNPSQFTKDDNLPENRVSWVDAIKFCNALSDKAGLSRCYIESTGECNFSRNGFRLPTEAEWEYACRAGTISKYYFGTQLSDLV